MASIYKKFTVNASPDRAWDAIRDYAAVHTRLAKGFVTNVQADGMTRTVTFANGFVVKETILTVDDENQRLAYTSVGGRASHHNASFQILDPSAKQTTIIWITDLLPDDVASTIETMMDQGIAAIQQTLA